MALSETDIVNQSLTLYGDDRINGLDDETEEARVLKLMYGQARDVMLADPSVRKGWTFARTRIDCGSEVTPAPIGQRWARAFAIPTTPFKVLRVIDQVDDFDNPVPWTRELDQILTNLETCQILYVAQITDVRQYAPLFTEALIKLIASRAAIRLAQDDQKSRALLQEFIESDLPRAIAANGAEIYVENEQGSPNPWAAGRYVSSVDGRRRTFGYYRCR